MPSLLVLALISACDADSKSSSSKSGLDSAAITAACDHFDFGEEEAVEAGADRDHAEHAHPHERLVVSLPEGTDGHTGYLHVHAEGGTETYLLFSEVVPVSATGCAPAGQNDKGQYYHIAGDIAPIWAEVPLMALLHGRLPELVPSVR
jgi:hypothetical protein